MNRSITSAWQRAAATSSFSSSSSSPASHLPASASGSTGGAMGKRRAQISLNAPLPTELAATAPPPAGSAAEAALLRKQSAVAEGAAQATDSPSTEEAGALDQRTEVVEGTTNFGEGSSSSGIKRKGRPSKALEAGDREMDESRGGRAPTPGLADPIASTTTNGSSTPKRLKRSNGAASGPSRKGKEKASAIAEKYAPPDVRFESLGGITSAIEKCLELIALPLLHPEIYTHTGIIPPRGVLLHGPPGCGKTRLAQAIAGEMGVPFLSVSAPSIVSGTSGESERGLRDLFEEAARVAPCIVFLDEIDAITPKRENAQREMERRIVAQLLTCLDDMSWENTDGKSVMVIGATNRPDSLDPALRRAGRFDHEITLGVPDEEGREQILRVLSKNLRLSGDFDFKALAKATPGYVGADLTALTSTAGIVAVKRIFQFLAKEDVPKLANGVHDPMQDVEMGTSSDAEASGSTTPQAEEPPDTASDPSQGLLLSLPTALQHSTIASFLRRYPRQLSDEQLSILSITNEDYVTALPMVQPSSKREGFATVPDVTWADIGALHETREELSMAIVQPIRRPELFQAVGVSASSGVMLWGPPGCGKTLLAKAVANESRANFISVKGPELLNKYVGESERAVRQVFARARASSPCVIFFDELDALVPKRDDALSEASSRVVNTLLTELDGLEGRGQTYVIAATNRPDIVDPAMCRPGRLDRLLYVDLPNASERLEILRTLVKKSPLLTQAREPSEAEMVVDLQAISLDSRAEGYSGADLAALVREAAVTALRETIRFSLTAEAEPMTMNSSDRTSPQVFITQPHFLAALAKIQPSVSSAQRKRYEMLRTRLAGGPLAQAPLKTMDIPAAEQPGASIDAASSR